MRIFLPFYVFFLNVIIKGICTTYCNEKINFTVSELGLF